MSEQEINERIAVMVGYYRKTSDGKWPKTYWVHPNGRNASSVPNYCADLNACHEAERKLMREHRDAIVHALKSECGTEWGFATALQRATALAGAGETQS